MSNDKTLATAKHGGCVQLGGWLPALPDTDWNARSDGSEPLYSAEQMRDYARAALAARQPVGKPKDDYESAFQEAEPPPLVVNAAGFRALESFLTVAEEFRRSTEPYIEAINEGGSAGDDEISEVFDRHLRYAKTAVSRSTVYAAPPAQAVDLGKIIEQIAQQWDGCNYDAVGETIDVGRAIRAAGKRLIDSLEVA